MPGAVGHVVTTGFASPAALRAAVEVHARRGRHGVPAFRTALDDWVLDGKPVDSVLEPAMRRLLVAHGLPPAQFHAVLCGYEVDFWIIGSPIVLECDGWDSHGRDRTQFERDRVRDAELAAAGHITVRFTYRQLMRRPGQVAERIRSVVRRWAPALLTAAAATADRDLGGDRPGFRDGTRPGTIPAQMAVPHRVASVALVVARR